MLIRLKTAKHNAVFNTVSTLSYRNKKNCLFSLQTETRICYLSQWPIAQMSLLLFNTKSDFKSQIGRRVVRVVAFLTANLLRYPL